MDATKVLLQLFGKLVGCLIGIGVIGIYALPEIKRKLGQVKIDERKRKRNLKMTKAREASRLKWKKKINL